MLACLSGQELDFSEVSTDGSRERRFPKPDLEIQFTTLQPNKLNIRRQGEDKSVTGKITRSARKRKSNEMEKVQIRSKCVFDNREKF